MRLQKLDWVIWLNFPRQVRPAETPVVEAHFDRPRQRIEEVGRQPEAGRMILGLVILLLDNPPTANLIVDEREENYRNSLFMSNFSNAYLQSLVSEGLRYYN